MSNTLQLTPNTTTTGPNTPESNPLGLNSTPNTPASGLDFHKILAFAQDQGPALVPTDLSGLGQASDRQESAAGFANSHEPSNELVWTLASQTPQVVSTDGLMDSMETENHPLSPHLTASSGNIPELLAGIEVQGLKSTALSHRMTLITSDQPAPDEVSLGDFARQQGIDEKTLRWLMGGPEAAATPPLTPRAGSAGSLPELLPGQDALKSAAQSPQAGTMVGTPLASGSVEPLRAPHLAAPMAQGGLNPHAFGSRIMLTSMSASMGVEAGQLLMATDHTIAGPAPLRPVGALNLIAPTTSFPPTAPNGTPVTGGQAPHQTVHSSHAPSSTITWSTLDIGVVRPESPAASIPSQPVSSPPPVDLDFSAVLGKEGLVALRAWTMDPKSVLNPSPVEPPLPTQDSVLSAEGWSATEPVATQQGEDSSTGHSQTGQGSDPKASGSRDFSRELIQQRSSTMTGQELADKMSSAIGKRLLEALDRGEWQMKFNLKPADLGHVEVDLKMRGNVLEAHFTASQSITRDLLEGGMGRLKDTLQQSGMDVASIKVNDGASSRSGGDSTPRQPGQGQNSELRTPKGETQSEPKIDGTIRANADGGLDLMV